MPIKENVASAPVKETSAFICKHSFAKLFIKGMFNFVHLLASLSTTAVIGMNYFLSLQ